ncbi:MAG: ABC transporter ATP-binding protein [Firmicutes bacterium]|nr:ABC transporter ATP-binding protein [Bacillota bacterium]
MTMKKPILQVEHLSVDFRQDRRTTLHAVRDVSFSVYPGETLGILGESGCGKSVTCMSILRLLDEHTTRYPQGKILFDGEDLLTIPESRLREIRGDRISMIFQEPMTSLNPLFTIGDQMMEMFYVHDNHMEKSEAYRRCLEAVSRVNIPNPERILKSYPFTLSGGMLQRVMIAMAMLNKPQLLICDEPTTALDVTIQAQVLDLMNELKKESGTAIIFVTHDLGVIGEMADRVMVMYGGRKCEEGEAAEVFADPVHPYTRGLIAAYPDPTTLRGNLPVIPGAVPALKDIPEGCPFCNRCEWAEDDCPTRFPAEEEIAGGHLAACHRWKEVKEHA